MAVAKPKTKPELILELKYQARLHTLHRRLFKRWRGVLAFIIVVGGSSVIVSALKAWPATVAIAAVVVAIVGFVDLIFDYAGKAAQHAIWGSRVAALAKRSGPMQVDELERELSDLSDAEVEFESLRAVAFNDALKSSGYEDGMRPETRLQRLFRVMA